MKNQKIKEFFEPGLLIVIGMGAFAVFMGSMLGYNFFLKPYLQVRESYNWHPVQATVLYSNIISEFETSPPDSRGGGWSGRTKNYLNLCYQYQWQSKIYTGKRYCFGKAPSGFEMHRLIRQMPQGTQINCFVDPDNPAESVVSRAIEFSAVGAGLCMTFILIGIAIIFFAVRSFLRGTWKCETED